MLLQQTQDETAAPAKPTGRTTVRSEQTERFNYILLNLLKLRSRRKERLWRRRTGGDGTWRLRGERERKPRTPGGGGGEKKS